MKTTYLRNPRSSDTCRRGSDGNGEGLPDAGVDAGHLGDEEGGHGLVQGGPVHVDGGPDGEDEPGDLGINSVLLLETVHGDGKCGGAGGCTPGRGDGPQHVLDEPEAEEREDTLVRDFSYSHLKGNFLQIITYIIGRTMRP